MINDVNMRRIYAKCDEKCIKSNTIAVVLHLPPEFMEDIVTSHCGWQSTLFMQNVGSRSQESN
jgi:hypothetical protein